MNAAPTPPNSPRLAPPGAGLPPVELFVARLLFTYRFLSTSLESAAAVLESERDRIRSLIDSCPPARLNRPVLIKRLPGIEDSSRYWSPLMTVEHLQIVNMAALSCIRELNAGRSPSRKADTAAVKPSDSVNPSAMDAFEKSCDLLLKTMRTADFSKSRLRHEHPWFGPLSAAQWFILAAFHMRLHRKQIQRILRAKP